MARTKEEERVYREQYRKVRYLHGPRKVDAAGTRRRLQGLMAVGWSGVEISRRMGFGSHWLDDTLRFATVSVQKRDAVKRLYARMWDEQPPTETREQKRLKSFTLTVARRNGWLPPAAWDDETIDDPDGQPSLVALDPETLSFAQRVQLAQELLDDFEMDVKATAARSHLSYKTVVKIKRGETVRCAA